MGGLLLLEEPLLHETNGDGVFRRYLGEGLYQQRLGLDGALVPEPAAGVVAPVHTHLVAGEGFLLEPTQQVEGRLAVAVAVEDERQLRLRVKGLILLVALQGVGIIEAVGLGVGLAV